MDMLSNWCCQHWWSIWSSKVYVYKEYIFHLLLPDSWLSCGIDHRCKYRETKLVWSVLWFHKVRTDSLWYHAMEMLSALLVLYEEKPLLSSEFPSQMASDAEPWCFLWCQPEEAANRHGRHHMFWWFLEIISFQKLKSDKIFMYMWNCNIVLSMAF